MSTVPEGVWAPWELSTPDSKRLKYKKTDTAIFEFDRGPNPYLNWQREYIYVDIDRSTSHGRFVSNHVYTLIRRSPGDGSLEWLTPFMSNMDHITIKNNVGAFMWWESNKVTQVCAPYCFAEVMPTSNWHQTARFQRLVRFNPGDGSWAAYDDSPAFQTKYEPSGSVNGSYLLPRNGDGVYIILNGYAKAYSSACTFENELQVGNGFDMFMGYDSVSKKIHTHQGFVTKVYDDDLALEATWVTSGGLPAFVGSVLRGNKKIGIGRDPDTGRLVKWEYAINGPMVYPAVPIDLGAWPFPGVESGYSTIYDNHSNRVAFWVPRNILEDVAFGVGGVFHICDFDGGGVWQGDLTAEMVDIHGAPSVAGGLGATQNLGDPVGFIGSGQFVTTANVRSGSFWIWSEGGGGGVGEAVLARWNPAASNNNEVSNGLPGTVHSGTVDIQGEGGMYIYGVGAMGPDYRFDSTERVNATGE